MIDPTRFAISIPQFFADGRSYPAGFRTYLARAEALGFESAWTGEQVLGSKPHLGPIETMTYAAAGERGRPARRSRLISRPGRSPVGSRPGRGT